MGKAACERTTAEEGGGALQYPPYIQHLADCRRKVLTAAQIAPIVGKDPSTLRYMARHMPERLAFPCITGEHDRSIRFPKWPFLEAFAYRCVSFDDEDLS